MNDDWVSGCESGGIEEPIFREGDLLKAGRAHALVIGVMRGYYDWQYDVLFESSMHKVDQGALREWLMC